MSFKETTHHHQIIAPPVQSQVPPPVPDSESRQHRLSLRQLCDKVSADFCKLSSDFIELHISCTGEKASVLVDAARLNQLLRGVYFLMVGSLNCGGTLTITLTTRTGEQLEEVSSYFKGKPLHAVISFQFVLASTYRTTISMLDYRDSDIFITRLAHIGHDIACLGGMIQPTSQSPWSLEYDLYIPCFLDEEASIAPPQKRLSSHTGPSATPRYVLSGKESILLVDGDSQVRRAAARILKNSGYTVTEAESGQEAEAILMECEGNIDLVLLDTRMPDKHGGQILMEMRQLFPDLQIMLSCGEQRDPCLNQIIIGNNHVEFLPKPYSPNDLLANVRRSLDR
jgi:CheY-like chemotaxis protein